MPRSSPNPYQSPSVETATEANAFVLSATDISQALRYSAIAHYVSMIGLFLSVAPLMLGGALVFDGRSQGDWRSIVTGIAWLAGAFFAFAMCFLMTQRSLAAVTIVGVACFLGGMVAGCALAGSAVWMANVDWRASVAFAFVGIALTLLLIPLPLRMVVIAWRFRLRGVTLDDIHKAVSNHLRDVIASANAPLA